MVAYQHILLAVDFFEHSETLVNKAKTLADSFQAKLSLIHVVENIPLINASNSWEVSAEIDMTSELIASAKKRITDLANKLDVNNAQVWVELGSPKIEITRVAEENKADLIVVGSHGKHGLALLLGSTSTGVLHYASCDVLAIRLPET